MVVVWICKVKRFKRREMGASVKWNGLVGVDNERNECFYHTSREMREIFYFFKFLIVLEGLDRQNVSRLS
jgi:hypothetical protein